MKVGVLGLGVVGLPTALYFAEKNLHVVGYDISSQAVEKAREKREAIMIAHRVGREESAVNHQA